MKLINRSLLLITILLLGYAHAFAGSLTDYAENKIVDDIFRTTSFTKPTNVYVGLVLQSAGCTDSAIGTEVSGGSYARVAIAKGDSSWKGSHGSATGASSGSNGTISNAGIATFPAATADWGNVGYFAFFDASTAGNMILCAPLTAQRNITTGSTPSFAIDALTVQIDN